MKKIFTLMFLSLAALAVHADGWENYNLKYTATTDLTPVQKAKFLRNMSNVGNFNMWDEPIKVYTRMDISSETFRIPSYQVLVQKIFNDVPVRFQYNRKDNVLVAPEDWIDTGWVIDTELTDFNNVTVEYDNIMADIDDSVFSTEIPLTCRFYVNNNTDQVVTLSFTLLLEEIEWGEWSTFGTAKADDTRLLQSFLSDYVLEIDEPKERPNNLTGANALWHDPITVEKRVSVNDPNLVQFRLNDIFNGVKIILDYDVEAGTIYAARQGTGYDVYIAPGKKPAFSFGSPYTEAKFDLPETAFDPTSGILDLTNAQVSVSTGKSATAGFTLLVTEESAINEIEADGDNTVEYFNLRGQRISSRPESGVYIERRNGRVSKRF